MLNLNVIKVKITCKRANFIKKIKFDYIYLL